MKRPLKTLAILVGTVLFLIVLAVIVAKVVFTKERILAMLTPRIEQRIKRPVTIGDAGISLWGGIGVRLGGILIGNKTGFSLQPLLAVEEIDIKARFWPLLAGQVVIDHVLVDHPAVLVEYDRQGASNWDGLMAADGAEEPEPPDQPEREGSMPFAVGHVIIEDGALSYRDPRKDRLVEIRGIDSEIRAAIGSAPTTFAFAIETALDSLSWIQGETHFALNEGEPRFHARGEWDRQTRAVRIDSALVEWRETQIVWSGEVRPHPGLWEVSLNARLLPTEIDGLLAEARRFFPALTAIDLSAHAQGEVEAQFVWPLEGAVPEWRSNIDLSDVHWKLPRTETALEIPRIELRGAGNAVSWLINSAHWQDATFSTSGTIDQVFSPARSISARVVGDVPAQVLQTLRSSSGGITLDGSIKADVSGFGSLRQWQRFRLTGQIASERLVIGDTAWSYDSATVACTFTLTGQDVAIGRCEWHAGESEGTIKGRIAGLIPAALGKFKTPDVARAELQFDCKRLDLDELIGPPPTTTGTTSSGEAIPFPSMLASGDLRCDTLVYSRLTITEANAPFTLRNNVLSVAPIAGNVYGGQLTGSLIWDLGTWPKPTFVTSLRADRVEANDLLSRYLGWAGGLFGEMSFDGEFAGQGRYAQQILPSLTAQGNANLQSGRLEAAPLLARIGERIGLKGLDQPRSIRDLDCPFRIVGGRLVTDNLRFETDEAEYTAVGALGLDQSLDFDVKIVANRAAGVPSALTRAGVRVHVGGTVTDPTISLDVREAGRAVVRDLFEQTKDTVKAGLGEKLKQLLGPKRP